jgi:hypothetical protein
MTSFWKEKAKDSKTEKEAGGSLVYLANRLRTVLAAQGGP